MVPIVDQGQPSVGVAFPPSPLRTDLVPPPQGRGTGGPSEELETGRIQRGNRDAGMEAKEGQMVRRWHERLRRRAEAPWGETWGEMGFQRAGPTPHRSR